MEILGMNEALEVAKTMVARNMQISAGLVIDMAERAKHADALAEALDSIVTDYNQYKALNGIDLTDDHSAKLDVKMTAAEAALAAYRGEL